MAELIAGDRERPFRAEDEAKIRTLLMLESHEALPDPVKDSYWQHKRLWDRLGYTSLSDEMIVCVVVKAGLNATAAPRNPWLIDALNDGSVKADSPIRVKIGHKVKPAIFKRLAQDSERARVHVEGDGEERLVRVTDVSGVA